AGDCRHISMIEVRIEHVFVMQFLAGAKIFCTSRAKKLLNARRAEIKLTGLRAPKVQDQLSWRGFPFLGELLPEPAERAGHSALAVANLHPFTELSGRGLPRSTIGNHRDGRFTLII